MYVVLFRGIVYVDLPNEGIGSTVYRFIAGAAMERAIKKYDETGVFDTGTYRLLAPEPSKRLNAQREKERVRRRNRTPAQKNRIAKRNQEREAHIKSKAYVVKTISQAGLPGLVRNGSGFVQTKIVGAR